MWRRVPWLVVVCSVLLMGLGLTGIARGDELFSRGVFFCFPRQLMWVCFSLPAMAGAMLVPYRSLRSLSYPAFAGSLLLLVVVLLMPSVNGARCWIPLGFMNFQPSELAKLVYVLAPMAVPGIASTVLLNIILAWNEAFWTLTLTTKNAAPLTQFIASYSSPEGLFWAKLSAASVLAIAPIVVFGWFSQKQLVQGLTFGAVK